MAASSPDALRATVVPWTPRRAPEHRRHQEVELHVGEGPGPWLHGRLEASALQRGGERRLIVELARVDGEIPIGGVGGHGQVAFADVEVDGLGPDQDHRLAVVAEGLERVEQDPARGHVFRVGDSGAIHARCLSSSR